MNTQYSLGIDIGGTNTVAGIVSRNGEIISKTSLPTRGHASFEVFLDALKTATDKMLAQHSNLEISGIGIGAPNGNFYNGTIEYAPNLEWEGVIRVAELVEQKFGIKTVLTNDANAAAIGEMIYGNARDMRDFIVITLGTGVGSGIVCGGELIYGHDGFAGEIGHTIAIPGGRTCGCGRKGCLETYASAGGVVKTALEIMDALPGKSVMENRRTQLKAADVYQAAIAGDEAAILTFEQTALILGASLANSVAHTSPEAIFLFGGVANAGDLLLTPLKESLEENLLNIYKGKVQILRSGLPDADAAILGAASLVQKYLK